MFSRVRRTQTTEMHNKVMALLVLSLTISKGECRCGDRLERALDMMQQRGNSARRRYDTEAPDAVYHQRLQSAPIEVSVTKLLVEVYYKLPFFFHSSLSIGVLKVRINQLVLNYTLHFFFVYCNT